MGLIVVKVTRRHQRHDCIIGELSVHRPFHTGTGSSFRCFTLELPWRGNAKGVSCVPPGRYPAFIRTDGKRKWRLELKKTAPRTNIQVHTGNRPREIDGCILVGTSYLGSSVYQSQQARNQLQKLVESEKTPREIIVEIRDRIVTKLT